MNLLNYLKTLDKNAANQFAERCRTSLGQLRQIAYGNRRASASLAINIERHSCGQIVCEQLRPDIDWGYLRAKPYEIGTTQPTIHRATKNAGGRYETGKSIERIFQAAVADV